MLFSINIRFQIAALLVLILVILDYAKTKHIRIMSTVFFKWLLLTTFVNILLDILCTYSVAYRERFTPRGLLHIHQSFIYVLTLSIFFEFLYIRLLACNQQRMTRIPRILTTLPIIISTIIIVSGKIDFEVKGSLMYAHGHMIWAVYVCATLYILQELYFVFSSRSSEQNLPREVKISIFTSLIIWIITLIVYTVWHIRFTALGLTLVVLVIYFSYENQRDNIDTDIGCFNKNAFNKILSEYYASRKEIYLVNLTITNYSDVIHTAGHTLTDKCMTELNETFKSTMLHNTYRIRTNTLSILWTKSADSLVTLLNDLNEKLENMTFNSYKFECHLSMMDLHKYTDAVDGVEDLIDYMYDHHSHDNHCNVCILDDEIYAQKIRHDTLNNLLEHSIEDENFTMVYQPIYDTKKKAFTSAEALIRMKDCGDLGFVSPEEFIPMAEEKGLILDIGDLTVELVSRFARENDVPSLGLDYIEINLSALQAVIPNLDQRLTNIVSKHNLPPRFINWEITETAMVDYGEDFENNMSNLRSLGYSFSMDDFGTGYSNLSQMNEIKYDLVKIDKSLIWPAFDDKNKELAAKAETLLHSVINMLHELNLGIVAEGVETKEMVDYLTEHGVEHLQGYYFSKPIPGNEFINFIKNA